jgi:uncharacterized protein YjiS (DUF1127 family)
MNARLAKEEIALLMPTTLSHYADEPRIMPDSDKPTFFGRVAGVLAWIADLPRRRSVLAELNELSDHELSDIGLNRSELNRVFDPEFAAERVRSRHPLGRALSV